MLELALQVSQVAEGSSIGRMWTRNNGWEEEEEEEEEEEKGVIRLILKLLD